MAACRTYGIPPNILTVTVDTAELFELCPCCHGEDLDCVWCEDSGLPGLVPHDCDKERN